MEFYIKKNATLPLLKMSVVKDGRSDYNNLMSQIETSSLFFSIVNVDNEIPKIITRPAGFVEIVKDNPDSPDEFYVYYKFVGKDTNKVGRYEGQFLIKNDDGNLIVPIREKLFINVQDSFINEAPCCKP